MHVGAASGFTFRSSIGRYTARGEIGVSVFFLISGFLLYRPFVAAALAGRPVRTVEARPQLMPAQPVCERTGN